ncbi:MAG: GRAM domain-containing protein [Bacteroidota bacterium]
MKLEGQPKKMSLKHRIIFALSSAVFYSFMLWLIYGFYDDSYKIEAILIQGVLFGIFFGIGFPYLNHKLAEKVTHKTLKKIQLELVENEEVLITGPANLFRGMEAVGGKLFLTNKRLVFIAHKMNFHKGQTDIYLSDIQSIAQRKTAKLVDNGFRIENKAQEKFDFVVNERDSWLAHIQNHQLVEKKNLN